MMIWHAKLLRCWEWRHQSRVTRFTPGDCNTSAWQLPAVFWKVIQLPFTGTDYFQWLTGLTKPRKVLPTSFTTQYFTLQRSAENTNRGAHKGNLSMSVLTDIGDLYFEGSHYAFDKHRTVTTKHEDVALALKLMRLWTSRSFTDYLSMCWQSRWTRLGIATALRVRGVMNYKTLQLTSDLQVLGMTRLVTSLYRSETGAFLSRHSISSPATQSIRAQN